MIHRELPLLGLPSSSPTDWLTLPADQQVSLSFVRQQALTRVQAQLK